jgi:hypothetical protein
MMYKNTQNGGKQQRLNSARLSSFARTLINYDENVNTQKHNFESMKCHSKSILSINFAAPLNKDGTFTERPEMLQSWI